MFGPKKNIHKIMKKLKTRDPDNVHWTFYTGCCFQGSGR